MPSLFYIDYEFFNLFMFTPVSLESRKDVGRCFSASATPGISSNEITSAGLKKTQPPCKADGGHMTRPGSVASVSLIRPYVDLGEPSVGRLRRPIVSFRICSFLHELMLVDNASERNK